MRYEAKFVCILKPKYVFCIMQICLEHELIGLYTLLCVLKTTFAFDIMHSRYEAKLVCILKPT